MYRFVPSNNCVINRQNLSEQAFGGVKRVVVQCDVNTSHLHFFVMLAKSSQNLSTNITVIKTYNSRTASFYVNSLRHCAISFHEITAFESVNDHNITNTLKMENILTLLDTFRISFTLVRHLVM